MQSVPAQIDPAVVPPVQEERGCGSDHHDRIQHDPSVYSAGELCPLPPRSGDGKFEQRDCDRGPEVDDRKRAECKNE